MNAEKPTDVYDPNFRWEDQDAYHGGPSNYWKQKQQQKLKKRFPAWELLKEIAEKQKKKR